MNLLYEDLTTLKKIVTSHKKNLIQQISELRLADTGETTTANFTYKLNALCELGELVMLENNLSTLSDGKAENEYAERLMKNRGDNENENTK